MPEEDYLSTNVFVQMYYFFVQDFLGFGLPMQMPTLLAMKHLGLLRIRRQVRFCLLVQDACFGANIICLKSLPARQELQ